MGDSLGNRAAIRSRVGLIGPFSPEVICEDGRVDVKRLAAAADLRPADLASILGIKTAILTESLASDKIQEPAIKFLAMMNSLAEHLQERQYARYWLRTPQPELDGLTALDWLVRGKLDEISDYVVRMVRFQPD